MKRPLFTTGTTLLVGTAVSFWFSIKQNFMLSVALLLTALLIIVLRDKKIESISLICLAAALSMAIGAGYKHTKIEPFYDYIDQQMTLEGFVQEAKDTSSRSTRYKVLASFPDRSLPDSELVIRDYIDAELKPGDKAIFTVKFQRPRHANVENYYLRQGIPLEGVLLEFPELIELNRKDEFYSWILRLRQTIKARNIESYSEQSANIVNAMVFGMTEDLSSEIYSDLNRSGTSHLVSVSGLHLSIFTAFVMLLLSYSPLPVRLWGLFAIFANLAFTFMVGFSPPIIRSCIMSIMFLLGNLLGRKSDSLTSLGLAAILIIFLRPYWALSLGMWLSYFATAGILIFGTQLSEFFYKRYKRESRAYNALIKAVSASLAVTLGAYIFTMPILMFKNGWFSIISPLANLLVSPFSSIVVIGGIIVAFSPQVVFSPVLIWLVDISARIILEVSQILSNIPFAIFSLDYSVLALGAFIAGIVILIGYFRRDKSKSMAIALSIAVSVMGLAQIITTLQSANSIELVALAEEQSEVLIRGDSAVLIGLPNRYNIEDLIKYLEYREIKSIDCIVASNLKYPLDSTLTRLSKTYSIGSVVAENDSLILQGVAQMLPGVSVYSAQDCELEFLGGVKAILDNADKKIVLYIGSQKVIIRAEKYDIINNVNLEHIEIQDGDFVLPPTIKLQKEPLGELIYNEKRLKLPI